MVTQLHVFPRHLSQHVGGLVITQGPLCELVPIENAAMPNRAVVQWDKDDLDALGILKVDCIALGMLTAIHKCFDLGEQWPVASGRWSVPVPAGQLTGHWPLATGHYPLTLATIPADDPKVYDMISQADTMGV